MDIKTISDELSVSAQITAADINELAAQGFRSIVCNRPDGEGSDQPSFEEIENAARSCNLETRYLPVLMGKVSDEDSVAFGSVLSELPKPVLGYCRTGTRTATLWSLSQAKTRPMPEILSSTKAAGFDMTGVVRRIANGGKTPTVQGDAAFDIVIVGGGF